ncbi:MAG TPA: T9SS type A sorting domain-containing protein [Bacteroidales bacterium]|nr:T9SS type A sorting domain-containing protein [Bacteroidales bacterium]HPT08818.1 T9SS type A sorting domain-containing protein [Bacteroidales bacterium]
MKRTITIGVFVMMAFLASGQSYLYEDFSAGQMPPQGWTILNLTNKWSCSNTNNAGGTAPEGKFSYTNGTYTTYLISPVVNLSSLTTVTLMFNYMYDYYTDPAPKIGVATRKGATGMWNTVWEKTPHGNINANTQVVVITNSDISANFQFAFFLEGNMYNLDYVYFDNINLLTPPPLDAALVSIEIPEYAGINQPVTLNGTISNMGSTPVNSFEAVYQLDDEAPVSCPFSGLNLPIGNTYTFAHTTPFVLENPGYHDLTVYIRNVNGTGDENPENDTLTDRIGGLLWVPDKKEFCEEATGTWCGWCVRGICFMNYMAETYPETWIGVAVHNGDPMVVADWDDEIPNIIPDFPGYPSGTINRLKMWDPQDFEAGYLEEHAKRSPASIEVINFSWDPSTRQISFDVQSQFLIDIDHELRFGAVIIEDSLWGTASGWAQANYYAGGSNGPMCGFESMPSTIPAAQMHYDHVGRAILDGPYGTEASITLPIIAGTSQSHSYSYTIPEGWNYEKLHFIGLLMDHSQGVILNANDQVIWVGTGQEAQTFPVRIFPNPVTDNASLKFTLDRPGSVQLRVYDLTGHCIQAKESGTFPVGEQQVVLQTEQLSQGIYFLEVAVNGMKNVQKLVVVR